MPTTTGSASNHAGTERGSVNHFIGVLGAVGTGKSTRGLAIACDLARQHGAYLIAHDVGWRLPEKFPGGTGTGIVRHDSIDSARAAIKKGQPGCHAIACDDAGEVIQLGIEIAQSSLEKFGDEKAPPVVILIDEMVLAKSGNPYRVGDDMRRALARRRHLHIAVVWTCQSPEMGHYSLLAQGSEIVCFRLTSSKAVLRLSQYVPDTPEARAKLAAIPQLANYTFVRFKLG